MTGGLRPHYTAAFRQQMVRRLTGPGAVSAQALGRETGVSQYALSKWLREARNLPEMTDTTGKAKMRTPDEKLRIVLEASTLDVEELGALLRKEGVYEVELRDWRKAMLDGLGGGRPPQKDVDLKRRVTQLEKELKRK